jgi:hypothetical protein
MSQCACGCGESVQPGKKWAHGHNSRAPDHTTTRGRKMPRARRASGRIVSLHPSMVALLVPRGVRVEASVRVPLESLAPFGPDQLAAFMAGVSQVIVAAKQLPTPHAPAPAGREAGRG